jgi:hypothetical protein
VERLTYCRLRICHREQGRDGNCVHLDVHATQPFRADYPFDPCLK